MCNVTIIVDGMNNQLIIYVQEHKPNDSVYQSSNLDGLTPTVNLFWPTAGNMND